MSSSFFDPTDWIDEHPKKDPRSRAGMLVVPEKADPNAVELDFVADACPVTFEDATDE